MEDSGHSLTLSVAEDVQCLTSNQEEADTKIFLHCAHILKENDTDIVVIRSPSGDTDILVLATALLATGERESLNRQWNWTKPKVDMVRKY